jgi:hypothetical protein
MARKITSGIVGRAVLGSLTTDNNSLQSVATNANLLLEPNGTGIVQSTKDLQINAANALRLADSDSSNYIALKSPATVSSNITYTLPGSGVTADYFLKTDGSGNLSWAQATITVTNQTADAATYYPAITTATSGTLTAVSTSSNKLTYVPSTGTLSSTEMRVTASTASSTVGSGALVVTGGLGVGGQLTATTIVETSSIVFKENVEPIDNALDKIMQLFGVTYDRKDNNEHEAGLIAEDVYKVVPELVSLDANGKPHGIKYTKLGAYLLESIKTLKAEIDGLKGIK